MVGDTSGYYQRMLVVLPQVLFQARELKWGTDEGTFITMFGTRSVSHLRRVFDKYMTISGFQIEETIDRETSGNLEQLLLAVDRFSSICCVDSDLVFIQDECLEAFLELQSFYNDRRDTSCFLQGKEMKKIQATKLLSDLTY